MKYYKFVTRTRNNKHPVHNLQLLLETHSFFYPPGKWMHKVSPKRL